jgi:hypothetical protein
MNKWLEQSWVLICVLGAFALGYMIQPMSGLPDKWQPGWEMLSAIATFCAVVVALRIARGEMIERKDREVRQSKVVARGVAERVRNLSLAAQGLNSWCWHLILNAEDGAETRLTEEGVMLLAPGVDMDFDDQALIDMAVLDDELPDLLRRSLREFLMARYFLIAAIEAKAPEQHRYDAIKANTETCRRSLNDLNEMVLKIETIFSRHGIR